MRTTAVLLAVGLLAGSTNPVSADVLNMPYNQKSLELVTVGDAGNTGEYSGAGILYGPDRICGAVDYDYRIGKYEVTAGQYCEFLNKVAGVDSYGLYNTNMWSGGYGYGCRIERFAGNGTIANTYQYRVASDYANRPVNYVSFWDACRFANWLHNGQPSGAQNNSTTEDGAYTLTAQGISNNTIGRNSNWKWAVTSEDEWYKAAYYKGNSTNAGYWNYPISGDSISTAMANYDSSVGHTTDVGSYGYPSPYGTYDQGGNVWEWNEAVIDVDGRRGIRGGDFESPAGYSYPHAAARLDATSSYESPWTGFRVSLAPEPATLSLLALGGLLLARRRRA